MCLSQRDKERLYIVSADLINVDMDNKVKGAAREITQLTLTRLVENGWREGRTADLTY